MIQKTASVLPGISIKRFIVWNTALWLILWGFSIWSNYFWSRVSDSPFSWSIVFPFSIPHYIVMIMAGPVLYKLYYRWARKGYSRQFIYHFFTSAVFGFVSQLALSLFYIALTLNRTENLEYGFVELVLKRYEIGFWFSAEGLLFYWLGFGLLFMVDLYYRNRQKEKVNFALETALNKAKFDTLQSQLQPHFLFNTFNSLSMMARQQKHEEVVNMIALVSNLFRETLSLGDQQQVTLKRELELVNHYLSIEQVRFRDSLRISLEVAEEAQSHLVPVLFMQPIVENAFRHGISKSEDMASLTISAVVRQQNMVIRISNSGPLLPPHWTLEEHMGIGLNNVLQRLDHVFGKAYTFTLRNLEDETGVVTEIILPID